MSKLDPMRALESLTPGGSEYVGDPEACVAAVRSTREWRHRAIINLTKRAKGAEETVARLTARIEDRTGLICLIRRANGEFDNNPPRGITRSEFVADRLIAYLKGN